MFYCLARNKKLQTSDLVHIIHHLDNDSQLKENLRDFVGVGQPATMYLLGGRAC